MKQRLGHYDIVAELGRGGMGVVYKGHESSLNRYVAIKVLADSLANDESVKERFLREARSMAALNDPHIIQIYFIGEDAGQTYFVMEFVDGESLGSMLKRERSLPVDSAAKIIYQTGLGLASAHDHGVVHRDIKPGNLMIGSRGNLKIADFGIALSNQDISKKLTSTGEFVGTPGYLSPEVCLGKPVDQRSDIFSLGVVLFEMLAGRMPFTDASPLGLMLEVVKADIPDVRELNANVAPLIATVLTKMIAKDPADRYQSCHELTAALLQYPAVAQGGPINVKPQISPAAATMVGQRMPTPAPASGPITGPAPLGAAKATARSASTQPVEAPPAAAQPTAKSRRPVNVVPWAIAALLLVGVASAAYTFRAHIPALNGLFGHTQVSVSNAANSPPMIIPDSASETQPSAAALGVAASTPAAPPAVAVNTDSAPTGAANSPDPASVDGRSATTGDQTMASANPPAPDSATNQAAPQDREVAQTTTAASARQLAELTPPKPAVPARPHVPTVAIMSAGDDVITGPAENAISRMLRNRGFRIIEGGHVSGDRPNLRNLKGRADAVVFVHARPVGSQELTYYGQSSTLYTVQLGIKTYAVSDAHLLGDSATEQVNFTSLNAADKARETITPMLQGLERDLADYRPRHGRG